MTDTKTAAYRGGVSDHLAKHGKVADQVELTDREQGLLAALGVAHGTDVEHVVVDLAFLVEGALAVAA